MTVRYTPVAGSHAIELCTIIVRFAVTATPETFERIRAAAATIAAENDLPANLQTSIPPQLLNVIGAQFPGVASALVYQRFAPNGQAEVELRCEQAAIALQVRKYEGWSKVAELLERTVLKVLPIYLSPLPAISSVTIQYDDRFLGGPSSEAVPAAEIFREGTPWITIYDRDSREQWHSTFGMFFRESSEGRQLINVNATVNDQQTPSGTAERTAQLTILVGEMFDIPGESPLIVTQEHGSKAVWDLLMKARTKQRQILEEVLSDPYLEAIQLRKGHS